MKQKIYSIPLEMVFKKYYCPNCGAKLEKDRTHRTVTNDDKDYYQFQNRKSFPKDEHEVYNYRFKCPSCNKRIAFIEQCIFERIQKKYNKKILSPEEIKDNYNAAKHKNKKRILVRDISLPIVFNIIFFSLIFFLGTKRTSQELIIIILIFLILTSLMIINIVRKFKGNFKLKVLQSYSHEENSQLERLHTYSSNNKDLISKSNECYCFYCKSKIKSKDIKEYIDEGRTALCPNCDIDSIIPNSIDETLNDEIIDKMNKYWF